LVLAHVAGVVVLEAISADGTKIHADASKSKAVSYKRLLEIEAQLRAEVEELFAVSEQAEQQDLPAGLVVGDEIARREAYLARLAEAKAVLEARAAERLAQEQAEYEAKLAQRGAGAHQRAASGRVAAPAPYAWSPRQRPVQLYRSGVAHHEESHRCGLRTGLQCATRRGPIQPAHRGYRAVQPP
jgi:hypothetical protein